MKRLLLACAPVLLVVSACSSGSEPPSNGASSDVAGPVETFRAQYQDAYNALPNEGMLSRDEYDILFQPIWASAESAGLAVQRRALPMTDGFTLTETESREPGHALFIELTRGDQAWCIASTWVLSPDDLTPEQVARVEQPGWEFVTRDGSCQEHVDFVLENFEDVDWLQLDEPTP